MISFPVFVNLRVENYQLFPGNPDGTGIDFTFQDGTSLIAGINGLGKTTLITMLYRMVVGPFELSKDDGARRFGSGARQDVVPWDSRRRFFTQRVPDRAKTAVATLTFVLGGRTFEVCRRLETCGLVYLMVDGQVLKVGVPETEYHTVIVEASHVGSFADFLTLTKYLTFFNEERRNILWDEQAQRQFFRILFLRPEDSREWARLEREIGQKDSGARNWSSLAYRMRRDLDELEASFLGNAGVGEELAVKSKLLQADQEALRDLEKQLIEHDGALKEVRRSLERSKIYEDEAERELEALRYSALSRLFPSLDDTARYVLTHLFSEGHCLACDADVPEERRRFEQMLTSGDCAVCGAEPARQRRVQASDKVAATSEIERRRLEKARQALDSARQKRKADSLEEARLMDSRRKVLEELGHRTDAIRQLEIETTSLRARLPPEPSAIQDKRKALEGIVASQRSDEVARALAEQEYSVLIGRLNETIRIATTKIAGYFSVLATAFLEEKCSLAFRMVSGRPSQNGINFDYPALKFEMTAAAFAGQQIRETPDDVSESQREFIDLAFRMALMLVASSDGPATLVMETPEASLDVIFMTKAADLLNRFAQDGRRVVVTSNLTNTALIPALIGGPLKQDETLEARWSRVLNLLELAAPNAALRNFRQQYSDFLEKAVEG